MRTKRIMVLGLPLIASCLTLAIRRGFSEPLDDRVVRIAELEIHPDQLDTYKAALKEEIRCFDPNGTGRVDLGCRLDKGSSRTDPTF